MIKISKFINDDGFKKWKKNNVTIRGIKEVGKDNGVYASFGVGLYSVPLSNKVWAKQYGTLHFVVNAIPQKPKIVQSWNMAELFVQQIISEFCKKHDKSYDPRFFNANAKLEDEIMDRGYDGLIIKGREMVHYKPKNIKYFKTEDDLFLYYQSIKG